MLAVSGKTYVLDGLEIDTSLVVVRRGGEEFSLRRKAFYLLVYLIENRNRLVPKEELIQQLWPETAVSDGALARCVAEIRRTLGEEAREPRFIRTSARMGYQFIGEIEKELPATRRAIAIAEPQTGDSEDLQIESAPLEPAGEAIAGSPHAWPARRMVLLFAAAALCVTAAMAVWSWARTSLIAEPEWWEAAWWKLNEGSGSKVGDSIHGLSATIPAGATWTQGISGPALLFAGRDSVRGNDPAGALPSGAMPRTLTAWVKANATHGDITPIFAQGDLGADSPPGSAFGLSIYTSGTAAFGTGHFTIEGKTRIDDNRWHQVTGLFDGGESRRIHLFVDGLEQASAQLAFPLTANKASGWLIGTTLEVSAIPAIVDDVRIYKRPLRSDEIRALYRCMAGGNDIDVEGGGSYYFAPIFGNSADLLPRRPGDKSVGVRNAGQDYAGMILVRREPDCALRSIHGADLGQDLTIGAELRVPRDPGGSITDAGPYFRSRRANPGDGIIGGTSAGFWVRLDSNGQVRVQRLHPNVILALSSAPDRFDASVFHELVVAARGEAVRISLDGRRLNFDVAGVQRAEVPIPPTWETTSPKGDNGGSAGIAFGSPHNRARAGGQEARNIRISVSRQN